MAGSEVAHRAAAGRSDRDAPAVGPDRERLAARAEVDARREVAAQARDDVARAAGPRGADRDLAVERGARDALCRRG